MSKNLNGLVKDWGGFEKLVAQLNETGSAQVQHNVVLTGKSGAPRQIDVAITHRSGLYEHLIIVECKYWKENVSRLHVDALQSAIQDLGASKGVIFSVAGFQEGAITAAQHNHIELFRVRELSDEEWGSPGRIVDFYTQCIERSIGNFKLEEVVPLDPLIGPVTIAIQLSDDPEKVSITPTTLPDGSPGQTVEEALAEASRKALNDFTSESFTFNGGSDGTYYMSGRVNFNPDLPPIVTIDGRRIQLKRMTFELGIKITQKRYTFDRAANYQFALLIEDCIRKTVSSATRSNASSTTSLAPYEHASGKSEGALKNGDVMKVYLTNYFNFSELAGLEPVPLESVRQPITR